MLEAGNAVIVHPSGRLSQINVSDPREVKTRLQHEQVVFRELQRTRRGVVGVWYSEEALFSREDPNPLAGAVMRRLTQKPHLPAFGSYLFMLDNWGELASGLVDDLAAVRVSPADAARYERLATDFQEQWRKLA